MSEHTIDALNTLSFNEAQAAIISKWLNNVSMPDMYVRYKAMVVEHIKTLPNPELFTESEFDDIFHTMMMFEQLTDLSAGE